MQNDEDNVIIGIIKKDNPINIGDNDFTPEELTAISYLKSHVDDESFSGYLSDDLLQIIYPEMEHAIHVLFPNTPYFQLAEYAVTQLATIAEERSDFGLEGTISAYRTPDAPAVPIVLPDSTAAVVTNRSLLNGQFVEREPGTFYRIDSNKPSITEDGIKIKVLNKDLETFKAAIELAELKGWDGIQVTGSERFRAEAWYQASIKGLEVDGYTPTPKDQIRLAEYKEQQAFEKAVVSPEKLLTSQKTAEQYALDKDMSVIYPSDQNDTRKFSGRVLEVFDHHVLQDIGRNTVALHEISRIGIVKPNVNVDIKYQGRTAQVNEKVVKTNAIER